MLLLYDPQTPPGSATAELVPTLNNAGLPCRCSANAAGACVTSEAQLPACVCGSSSSSEGNFTSRPASAPQARSSNTSAVFARMVPNPVSVVLPAKEEAQPGTVLRAGLVQAASIPSNERDILAHNFGQAGQLSTTLALASSNSQTRLLLPSPLSTEPKLASEAALGGAGGHESTRSLAGANLNAPHFSTEKPLPKLEIGKASAFSRALVSQITSDMDQSSDETTTGTENDHSVIASVPPPATQDGCDSNSPKTLGSSRVSMPAVDLTAATTMATTQARQPATTKSTSVVTQPTPRTPSSSVLPFGSPPRDMLMNFNSLPGSPILPGTASQQGVAGMMPTPRTTSPASLRRMALRLRVTPSEWQTPPLSCSSASSDTTNRGGLGDQLTDDTETDMTDMDDHLSTQLDALPSFEEFSESSSMSSLCSTYGDINWSRLENSINNISQPLPEGTNSASCTPLSVSPALIAQSPLASKRNRRSSPYLSPLNLSPARPSANPDRSAGATSAAVLNSASSPPLSRSAAQVSASAGVTPMYTPSISTHDMHHDNLYSDTTAALLSVNEEVANDSADLIATRSLPEFPAASLAGSVCDMELPPLDAPEQIQYAQVVSTLGLSAQRRASGLRSLSTTILPSEEGMGFAASVTSSRMRQAVWELQLADIAIETCVGVGSFSKVYTGMLRSERVAIKKLTCTDKAPANLTTELREEAELLGYLSHPNIIRFMGAVLTEPDFCIVMEFATGGTLSHRLAKGEPAEAPLLHAWMMQLASAMYYLHFLAPFTVIHSDLKSANILLGKDDAIKLTDFGLARRICSSGDRAIDFLNSSADSSPAGSSTAGTFGWMSPEVIRGSRVTRASDVWSYGVVLWEMLTREVPFNGVDGLAVAYGVATGRLSLTIPATLPEPLAQLLRDCWASDACNRPDFGSIMTRLEAVGRGAFVHTRSRMLAALQAHWRADVCQDISIVRALNIGADVRRLVLMQRSRRHMDEALQRVRLERDESECDGMVRSDSNQSRHVVTFSDQPAEPAASSVAASANANEQVASRIPPHMPMRATNQQPTSILKKKSAVDMKAATDYSSSTTCLPAVDIATGGKSALAAATSAQFAQPLVTHATTTAAAAAANANDRAGMLDADLPPKRAAFSALLPPIAPPVCKQTTCSHLSMCSCFGSGSVQPGNVSLSGIVTTPVRNSRMKRTVTPTLPYIRHISQDGDTLASALPHSASSLDSPQLPPPRQVGRASDCTLNLPSSTLFSGRVNANQRLPSSADPLPATTDKEKEEKETRTGSQSIPTLPEVSPMAPRLTHRRCRSHSNPVIVPIALRTTSLTEPMDTLTVGPASLPRDSAFPPPPPSGTTPVGGTHSSASMQSADALSLSGSDCRPISLAMRKPPVLASSLSINPEDDCPSSKMFVRRAESAAHRRTSQTLPLPHGRVTNCDPVLDYQDWRRTNRALQSNRLSATSMTLVQSAAASPEASQGELTDKSNVSNDSILEESDSLDDGIVRLHFSDNQEKFAHATAREHDISSAVPVPRVTVDAGGRTSPGTLTQTALAEVPCMAQRGSSKSSAFAHWMTTTFNLVRPKNKRA
ncbi:hypothetical protein CAOG_01131 [Capsaspora owczarzaki ATCC 30864]|uniref:hypothetical protein n=1 Tax=Capsaspora owczarzaki (strain ATCC 30864) TaxID=595528 RepID=UPI0003523CB7|nr:hypothetical protein CAOG_01131 [Capsaspora owczarzaki ATCC 30864]|eukprot:XP_004366002.2 hypothetical protein CAOG_01131 [Capsaspora owczarzaki ATCC 30864]